MKNKAFLLDRDGTINIDTGYLYRIDDWEFEPRAIEALQMIKAAGYKIIVTSNQSGVARGYYTEQDIKVLHEQVNKLLKKHDACIDGFYYCPHYEHGTVKEYVIECSCRKPNLGMYEKAIKEFNLDPSLCFVVGDKMTDIERVGELGINNVGFIDHKQVRNGYKSLYEFVTDVAEKGKL